MNIAPSKTQDSSRSPTNGLLEGLKAAPTDNALWSQLEEVVRRKAAWVPKAKRDDVVQEALLKIFRNIGKFDSRQPGEGWIGRIVSNCVGDDVRKNKNDLTFSDLSGPSGELPPDPVSSPRGTAEEPPLLRLVTAEELALFQAELKSKRTRVQQVYHLLVEEGLTLKAAAERLGENFSTVKGEYYKAMREISQKLSEKLAS